MRAVVTIARIITGTLFIFSGLVKAIDPRGLSYKMEEFFEVFAREGYLPGMMESLSEHALTFSIIMITLEVVLGVALLLGWQKKLTAWLLLLLMVLFTFLTSFVLFSGKIAACGCFGDCIPITPLQTFVKDVALLVLILLILLNLKYIRPLNKPLILLLIIIAVTIATLFLQFHVMKNLPLVDCLPFKKGNNILELRKMPANAISDKYDYKFVYEKAGVRNEFTAAAIPDSTWTFVERKQVLIEKGSNNLPLINDFKFTAADGSDSTEAILSDPALYYLLFLQVPSKHTDDWLNDLRSFTSQIEGKQKLYLISSHPQEVQKILVDNGINVTGVYSCDATAIKTAARSNPALYLMQGPVVKNKWGWADFDDISSD